MNRVIQTAISTLRSRRMTDPSALSKSLETIIVNYSINTSAGTREYAIPVDYLEMAYVYYAVTHTTLRLPCVLRDPLQTLYTENNVYLGDPTSGTQYFMRGFNIIVHPVPNVSVVSGINVYYYGKVTPITSGSAGSEIPLAALLHEAVIYAALGHALIKDNKPEEANIGLRISNDIVVGLQ